VSVCVVKRTRHKTPLQFTLNSQPSGPNLANDYFRTASPRLENGFRRTRRERQDRKEP
jgi:hypothetical protein